MASVIYVAGARPNFMKVAPILRAARGGPFESVLVHTGQHYDHAISGVFFEQPGIPAPDVHLEVGSATHGVQTGKIMAAFEAYLLARSEKPRGIVVVGDVNSTMACALVGAKLGIAVPHVEAGLRSFDRTMPEEINRIVTDQVSDLLLVSEPSGLVNLEREGIPKERLHYVGNVMIDSLVSHLPTASALDMPGRLGLPASGYAVVTLHRPSNVDNDDRLQQLVTFLEQLGAVVPVVFPAHPRTQARLQSLGLINRLDACGAVRVMSPLGYLEFLGLVASSALAVTDSGGVQEETTYLGVPCVTLRNNTERPVTTTLGTNVLVGDRYEHALTVVRELVRTERRAARPIDGWDGAASSRIAELLVAAFRQSRA